jgi:hypothetical protein
MTEELIEGWHRLPFHTRKWHCFRNKRSLCRNFGLFGTEKLEQGNDNSSDNCAECKRKKVKKPDRKSDQAI